MMMFVVSKFCAAGWGDSHQRGVPPKKSLFCHY